MRQDTRLQRALNALGDTPDKVRAHLKRRHIRLTGVGVLDCPITQFARRFGYHRVLTSVMTILAVGEKGDIDSFDVPSAVQDFIKEWDKE